RRVRRRLRRGWRLTRPERIILERFAKASQLTLKRAKDELLRRGLRAATDEMHRRRFVRFGPKWVTDARGKKEKQVPRLWLDGKLTGAEKRWRRGGPDRIVLPRSLTAASVDTFSRWFEQAILAAAGEHLEIYAANAAGDLDLDRLDGQDRWTAAATRAWSSRARKDAELGQRGEGQRIRHAPTDAPPDPDEPIAADATNAGLWAYDLFRFACRVDARLQWTPGLRNVHRFTTWRLLAEIAGDTEAHALYATVHWPAPPVEPTAAQLRVYPKRIAQRIAADADLARLWAELQAG
ncbi:MAG: hypothetical protein ACRDKS_03805, partial [Actinomycetota bacterium]